jgi:hypothetical protein
MVVFCLYCAQRCEVVEWIRHPYYDDNSSENDFALLRLEADVTLDTDIEFSINDSKNIKNGEDLVVLGHGVTEEGGNSLSPVLNDVQVQAFGTFQCNKNKWYNGGVDDATMFCAGE